MNRCVVAILNLVDHKDNLDDDEGDGKDRHEDGTEDSVGFVEVAAERVEVAKEEEGCCGDIEVMDWVEGEHVGSGGYAAPEDIGDVDVGCDGEAEVDGCKDEHDCSHLAYCGEGHCGETGVCSDKGGRREG